MIESQGRLRCGAAAQRLRVVALPLSLILLPHFSDAFHLPLSAPAHPVPSKIARMPIQGARVSMCRHTPSHCPTDISTLHRAIPRMPL